MLKEFNWCLRWYCLLQDVRVGLSLSSASGAKREKLLQRNAILRRTGFIEAGTRTPGFGKNALPGPTFRYFEAEVHPSAILAADFRRTFWSQRHQHELCAQKASDKPEDGRSLCLPALSKHQGTCYLSNHGFACTACQKKERRHAT